MIKPTLLLVFPILDSLFHFFIHCQNRNQRVILDSCYSLCYLLMAKSFSQHTCLSTPGLRLLLSVVLVWAVSICHPDQCKGSLTNFHASDFGSLHLYVTIFLHVAISSNFSHFYNDEVIPFLIYLPKRSKCLRTNTCPYKVFHVWSCLPNLTNTFCLYFSFQFSHTFILSQMITLLLQKHFPIFSSWQISTCPSSASFEISLIKPFLVFLIGTILLHSYCRKTCFHYVNY